MLIFTIFLKYLFQISTLSIFINNIHVESHGLWTYDHQNDWDYLCKHGTEQSPINIIENETIYNANLYIVRDHYEIHQKNFSLVNTGHTVRLQLNLRELHDNKPSITGSALDDDKYYLDYVHFHWSRFLNGKGSEHAVDGKYSLSELHMVHYNGKYKNITNAVNYPDGLAVIAVFIELSEQDNPHMNPIVTGFDHVLRKRNAIYFSKDHSIDFYLDNLLPKNKNKFFRYQGSLTTPKCFESVNWIIFKDTQYIGKGQLAEIRRVLFDYRSAVNVNIRHLQDIGDRVVERSWNDDGLYNDSIPYDNAPVTQKPKDDKVELKNDKIKRINKRIKKKKRINKSNFWQNKIRKFQKKNFFDFFDNDYDYFDNRRQFRKKLHRSKYHSARYN